MVSLEMLPAKCSLCALTKSSGGKKSVSVYGDYFIT